MRLLFIGESPPASGRFFYCRDSGLYRAIREAFQVADARITDDDFLARFQASGCYLVDLCREPIDHLPAPARREERRRAEPRLAESIREHRPEAIIVLLRAIEPNVSSAAQEAGWTGSLIEAPYPGRWKHLRQDFLKIAAPVVKTLL